MMRRAAPIVLVLLVSAACAIAAVLAWRQAVRTTDAALPGFASTESAAGHQRYDGQRDARLQLSLDDGGVLTSPATGLITRSECSPNSTLTSGQLFAEVDGAWMVALSTSQPLWRDLARGSKGRDVTNLQEELVRLGYTLVPTGVFDRQTDDALIALAYGLGYAHESGFRATQALWLPSAGVELATCELAVGSPITIGTPVATGPPGVSAAALSISRPPNDNITGAWEFRSGEVIVPLDDDRYPLIDADQLDAIVAASSAQPDGSRVLDGAVRLVTPIDVLAVPPAAVVALDTQHGCVVDVATGSPVEVDLIDSELGRTLITAAPVGLMSVALDPIACRA
ncbi:MAG TPA: peptidoglycan-binding domain-containing protein [Ilumatobacteraceae bacterium]|nr:peptidoglycan-binding domain-containing protein [Ilumatobacteraceae bacterium]